MEILYFNSDGINRNCGLHDVIGIKLVSKHSCFPFHEIAIEGKAHQDKFLFNL